MNAKLLLLLMLGIWIGLLLGISFIEAPLKFQAPNITLALGLGIGKLVFGALNKLEIVGAVLLTLWLLTQRSSLDTFSILSMCLIIVAVLIQTVWLIPILHARADQIIQGINLPSTSHHFYYIAFEVFKFVLLIYTFVKTYHYEGHPG